LLKIGRLNLKRLLAATPTRYLKAPYRLSTAQRKSPENLKILGALCRGNLNSCDIYLKVKEKHRLIYFVEYYLGYEGWI